MPGDKLSVFGLRRVKYVQRRPRGGSVVALRRKRRQSCAVKRGTGRRRTAGRLFAPCNVTLRTTLKCSRKKRSATSRSRAVTALPFRFSTSTSERDTCRFCQSPARRRHPHCDPRRSLFVVLTREVHNSQFADLRLPEPLAQTVISNFQLLDGCGHIGNCQKSWNADHNLYAASSVTPSTTPPSPTLTPSLRPSMPK